MERSVNEVGEVFRRGFDTYKTGKNLSFRVYKVAKDIMECRTAKMGGHKLTCQSCGDVQISYNSCKNRHCPKCQFSKREQWILDRDRDLLPVRYFHVIFTVPHELNKLHLSHGGQMYDLFFKSAWKAWYPKPWPAPVARIFSPNWRTGMARSRPAFRPLRPRIRC